MTLVTFDLSSVQYSRHDIRRGLRIPTEMAPDLAEFIGIIVGDGHVRLHNSKKRTDWHYEVWIYGNLKEKTYYTGYVGDLIHRVFSIRFNHKRSNRKNTFSSFFCSKALYLFLHNVIGIPQRKDGVGIPSCILDGGEVVWKAFLRGLYDADGCLTLKFKPHPYPVLQARFKSRDLTLGCATLFRKLGIGSNFRQDISMREGKAFAGYRVDVCGKRRVALFMNKIGFANVYKTFRFYEFFIEETRLTRFERATPGLEVRCSIQAELQAHTG
jgi:hypothetical protein